MLKSLQTAPATSSDRLATAAASGSAPALADLNTPLVSEDMTNPLAKF